MTIPTRKSEEGLRIIGEMMSPEFSEQIRAHLTSGNFGAEIARFGLEHSFVDVWGRDGMERKLRSLVIIGVMIGLRQPKELANHVRIALNNGLSVKEIEEAMITASPYVGLPAIATAHEAIMGALRSVNAL